MSFVTNPDILKYQDNIILIRKDDIQKLTKFENFKHNIRPYNNIFNKNDCDEIIKFLKKNNFENKDIIFQCEYGKSRSLTTAICLYNNLLNKTHNLKIENNIVRNKVIEKVILNYFKRSRKNV